MDTYPSDTPHSNERDLFKRLEGEMHDYMLLPLQEKFINSIRRRSLAIDASIEEPDNELFIDHMNEAHEDSNDVFAEYIQTLFAVKMDVVARQEYIKIIFIDTDYSQNALNHIVHGNDFAYDHNEIAEEIAELFEYEDDDVVQQEIIQKFRREFGDDVDNFLGVVNTDGSKFLAVDNRRRNLNRLHDELVDQGEQDESDLISAVDDFYEAQHDRLAITKVFDVADSEVIDAHQFMIEAFGKCVDTILRIDMDESDRVELITGLFIVTDKTQNNYFMDDDNRDQTLRNENDFAQIRKRVKRCRDKKTDIVTKSSHFVRLYDKEFADDLDILIDQFGKMD